MFCKNCGKEVAEGARYCAHCGEETGHLPAADKGVGAQMQADGSAFFGKEVRLEHESEQTSRTAMVLGVFFGAFGGHAFYAGHTIPGIAKVVMTIIGFLSIPAFMAGNIGLGLAMVGVLLAEGIWNLIDLIFIANGEYKDKLGKRLHKNL